MSIHQITVQRRAAAPRDPALSVHMQRELMTFLAAESVAEREGAELISFGYYKASCRALASRGLLDSEQFIPDDRRIKYGANAWPVDAFKLTEKGRLAAFKLRNTVPELREFFDEEVARLAAAQEEVDESVC